MVTENARIDEIRAKAEASQELRSIEWQNGQVTRPVINISISNVLLNTNSHRIRSQRESHPDAELLANDPWCERAQEIVATFLRETPKFQALKDSLSDVGQLEPGHITEEGVLINGNTRAVALRELGESHIKVVVLPFGATEPEHYELEARLQLRREYKQEYTLTNELLFILEQIESGRSKEALALLLGKAQSSNPRHLRKGVDAIDKSIRILGVIRELQDKSGKTIPLVWFDQHESALNEADDAYITLRDRDPAQARRVLAGRMTGLLVGTVYRDLRKWDGDDFVSEYITPALQESDVLLDLLEAAPTDGGATDGGLDVEWLEEGRPERSGEADYAPELFLGLAAEYREADEDSEVVQGVTKAKLFEHLESVISSAAREKELAERAEGRRLSPIRLLQDARRSIMKVSETLERARSEPGFDRKRLNYELNKTRREIEALARTIGTD